MAKRVERIASEIRELRHVEKWPNGADPASDEMYDAIREHGVRS